MENLQNNLKGFFFLNFNKNFFKVSNSFERAKIWKEKQISESEVFPSCNSEWQQDVGGRVWCSNKRYFFNNYLKTYIN